VLHLLLLAAFHWLQARHTRRRHSHPPCPFCMENHEWTTQERRENGATVPVAGLRAGAGPPPPGAPGGRRGHHARGVTRVAARIARPYIALFRILRMWVRNCNGFQSSDSRSMPRDYFLPLWRDKHLSTAHSHSIVERANFELCLGGVCCYTNAEASRRAVFLFFLVLTVWKKRRCRSWRFLCRLGAHTNSGPQLFSSVGISFRHGPSPTVADGAWISSNDPRIVDARGLLSTTVRQQHAVRVPPMCIRRHST
jgi:hypothetical protein